MAYTNSSLVSYTKISPNRTSPRNHVIDTISIHCVVGQCTVQSLGNVFASSARQASSNYGIGYDGKIGMYVEEKDRSWCTSSASNDHRAITIEVASDTKHPYAVTDKALSALIELLVDICKRNNIKELKWKGDKSLIGQVDKQNMTVHRWFAKKSCPGDYLYNLHGDIAKRVNEKLGASTPAPTPAPTAKPTPVIPPNTNSSSSDLVFKVGDIVNFAGGKHYSSANAVNGTSVKSSRAKITSIAKNGKHPYHCRAVNDSGFFIGGGVFGWVDANSISKGNASSATSTTTTTTAPNKAALKSGDRLDLKNVALYNSSTAKVGIGLRTGTYYVWNATPVNGKIRITNSALRVGKVGQVTGWINVVDAEKSAGISPLPSTPTQTTPTPSVNFSPYLVKVDTDNLNIRKGAGTNYGIIGSIKGRGIYTIVDEATGKGATKWGLLKTYQKNRNGWISLDFTKKV